MKRVLFLMFLLLVGFSLTAQEFKSVEAIGMRFEWRFTDKGLEVKLTGPTSGWIAVGFNPSAMMQDADFKIGYVDSDGKAVVEDHYGHRRVAHQSDNRNGGAQDITDIRGSEKDGVTELHFTLPLDSNDENDKPFVRGDTYKVLLAYGASDQFRRHTKRTSVEVKLD